MSDCARQRLLSGPVRPTSLARWKGEERRGRHHAGDSTLVRCSRCPCVDRDCAQLWRDPSPFRHRLALDCSWSSCGDDVGPSDCGSHPSRSLIGQRRWPSSAASNRRGRAALAGSLLGQFIGSITSRRDHPPRLSRRIRQPSRKPPEARGKCEYRLRGGIVDYGLPHVTRLDQCLDPRCGGGVRPACRALLRTHGGGASREPPFVSSWLARRRRDELDYGKTAMHVVPRTNPLLRKSRQIEPVCIARGVAPGM